MIDVKKALEKNLSELDRVHKHIGNVLANAPEGTLRSTPKKGRYYFYHQIRDKEKGKYQNIYLNKKKDKLKEILAEKKYCIELKPYIESEIECIKRMLKAYHPEKKLDVYKNATPGFKQLVKPYFNDAEYKVQQWMNEKYIPHDGYAENKIYETFNGEKVRSKSEVIIANLLYSYKDVLLYRYEPEVILSKTGTVVHPDFYIINLKTGRKFYFEHFGMMDNPRYADEFVKKMNSYSANGLILGRDVLCSFESSIYRLDINSVRRMIEGVILAE